MTLWHCETVNIQLETLSKICHNARNVIVLEDSSFFCRSLSCHRAFKELTSTRDLLAREQLWLRTGLLNQSINVSIFLFVYLLVHLSVYRVSVICLEWSKNVNPSESRYRSWIGSVTRDVLYHTPEIQRGPLVTMWTLKWTCLVTLTKCTCISQSWDHACSRCVHQPGLQTYHILVTLTTIACMLRVEHVSSLRKTNHNKTYLYFAENSFYFWNHDKLCKPFPIKSR